MNNQMPYFNGMNPNQDMNQNFGQNQGNFHELMFDRLNNRINRLERRVRMIENRLNMMEGGNPTFLKNNLDSDDNMYML